MRMDKRGAAGAIVGFVAVAMLIVVARTQEEGSTRGRDTAPISESDSCGPAVSLDEATRAVPFQLLLPDHALANDESRTALELCSETFIQFRFSSGIVLTETVNTLEDPETVWERMAKDYREFSVGSVNGLPASLADPSVDDALGGVDLVTNDGARIIVTGNGKIPLEELVGVAESLRPANDFTS